MLGTVQSARRKEIRVRRLTHAEGIRRPHRKTVADRATANVADTTGGSEEVKRQVVRIGIAQTGDIAAAEGV